MIWAEICIENSQDIVGTIPDMFNQAVSFFTRNLHYIQKDKNFNSVGT